MHPKLTGSARILSLIGLIGISFLLSVHAMPPPSAFGVWDRGSSFDPKDHPFLKGLAFNEKWADLEKQPGLFDWSALDQAMDKDDIFSLIEVHRGKLETPVLLPPTDYKVSDQAPRPAKVDKAGKPGKEKRERRKKTVESTHQE